MEQSHIEKSRSKLTIDCGSEELAIHVFNEITHYMQQGRMEYVGKTKIPFTVQTETVKFPNLSVELAVQNVKLPKWIGNCDICTHFSNSRCNCKLSFLYNQVIPAPAEQVCAKYEPKK